VVEHRAAAALGFIGFAVGRTSFWEPLVAWRDERMSTEEAADQIEMRRSEWVDVFEKDGAAVELPAMQLKEAAMTVPTPPLQVERLDRQKQEAAARAVEFIESGMTVGLGAGSTAAFAVRRIAELLHQGRLHDIVGIACSRQVGTTARQLGIPLTTLEDRAAIDLTIDGADEVDPDLNLIKGGGGCLLHEKIVAQASRREIIIVDASKPSPRLGTKWALPVEVIPFGWGSQRRFLEELGARVTLRQTTDGRPFKTDEGNFILDAAFGPIADPVALARELDARTGIVEHGLFIDMATDLLVAGDDGIQHVSRAATSETEPGDSDSAYRDRFELDDDRGAPDQPATRLHADPTR
jgi:ribose 5-phosphate isomerase A